MTKIKTAKQQLSNESITSLATLVESRGWKMIQVHQEDDFGIDGQIDLFTPMGKDFAYENEFFKFQLKSTSAGKNKEDFSIEDLELWQRSPVAFFIFFWNKSENKHYWVNLHEYYNYLRQFDREKLNQKYTTIVFRNLLDEKGFNAVETITKNYCGMAAKTINENENKKITIKDFISRGGRVPVLGYSLENTNLSGVKLKGAIMMGTKFSSADLSQADMRSGAFMGADFSGANLAQADLRACSFMGTYFENADLRKTKLQGAAFMGAFLSGADFRGAELDKTSLWSISKAYDYEKATFDEGIRDDIKKLAEIKNLVTNNLEIQP